ncbi:MAG: hypothetical protein M3R27_07450 [Bacteroidota bacterium]|nr:hypothetical protein [Bacteroidota bacterium]
MKHLSLLILILFSSECIFSQKLSERFRPTYLTGQYAGSMGFASIGVGSSVTTKTTLSLHYGYVPSEFGGKLHINTLKYSYQPFFLKHRNVQWKPLNPTFFITYHWGNKYYVFWPKDMYPKDYYWWTSAFRFHPALSSELTLMKKNEQPLASLFLEANTNDLYIFSYYKNQEYLSLADIIKLGAGIKIHFQ